MKKRHWVFTALIIVVLVSLLLTACEQQAVSPTSTTTSATTQTTTSKTTTASTTPTKPAEVKTIKVSYSCPKGKGYGAGEEWFVTEFPARTNGRYKVEAYAASTLVPITAVLDSVRKGVCEIGLTSTAQFAKDFPLSMLTMLPTLGWPGTNEYAQWFDAAIPAWMEWAKTPEVWAELNNGFTFGWNDLLTHNMLVMKDKEVHYPADFKGTKIGAIGSIADIVKANGGATVAVVTPEIYMNMDKGVIEGASMSATMVTDWKIQTIADYFFNVDLGTGNMLVLYNNEFYNSLPPADKKLFDDVRLEVWEHCRDYMLGADKTAYDILATDKVPITQPTPEEIAAWKAVVNEVCLPGWKADCKSVGISDAVIDKVYNEWIKTRTNYWKKYNLPGEP